uniref:Uncharacterized protein n=1 Tax=Poecilia latipinna TaxID=48699 RepID=A0A3B3TQE3_9TELE
MFWLEEGRVFGMGMTGEKATELLQIAGEVGGNVAFDLRARTALKETMRSSVSTPVLKVDLYLIHFHRNVSSQNFMCMDRRNCIPRILLCDGRAHCHDGSDEVDCPTVAAPLSRTNVLKCRSGSVLCQDGSECVLYSHVCDGEADCKDGSDEWGCGDFRCKDHRSCVPKSSVCDGHPHCLDGSDEADCPNVAHNGLKCRFGSKRCRDGLSCVLMSHICDGERDCQDGSDEDGCGKY